MAGGLTGRAAMAALNYLTGRTMDIAPIPQTVSLALLTAAPPANPTTIQLTEVTSTGYFRQPVTFSAATNTVPGQPSRIENSGNILFGPFTAGNGLEFPTTHCALMGTGAAASTANLLDANTAGIETDASGWQGATNATVSRSTAQFRTGAASLLATSTASGTMKVITSAFSSVKIDHVYEASFWAFTPVAGLQVQCDIEWYDASDALVSTSSGTSSTLTANTWTKITRTATLRLSNVTKAKIVMRPTATAASQNVYLDDAAFAATKTDEILMTWSFDTPGQAAQNESLQISAGDLSMTLG